MKSNRKQRHEYLFVCIVYVTLTIYLHRLEILAFVQLDCDPYLYNTWQCKNRNTKHQILVNAKKTTTDSKGEKTRSKKKETLSSSQ